MTTAAHGLIPIEAYKISASPCVVCVVWGVDEAVVLESAAMPQNVEKPDEIDMFDPMTLPGTVDRLMLTALLNNEDLLEEAYVLGPTSLIEIVEALDDRNVLGIVGTSEDPLPPVFGATVLRMCALKVDDTEVEGGIARRVAIVENGGDAVGRSADEGRLTSVKVVPIGDMLAQLLAVMFLEELEEEGTKLEVKS